MGKRGGEGDKDLKSGCPRFTFLPTTARMFTGLVNNLSCVIVASIYPEDFVD